MAMMTTIYDDYNDDDIDDDDDDPEYNLQYFVA